MRLNIKGLDYFLLLLINFFILYFYLDLKSLNMDIPLVYHGDGLATIKFFKIIISGEYPFYDIPRSEFIGAPFGQESYDFPNPVFSNWIVIKILSILNDNHFVVFNLYILLTFVLNPFAMYYVLRKFRVNIFLAIVIATLFNFLPFHLIRTSHTFYLGYFFIPLWTYYLILLWNKKPLFYKFSLEKNKHVLDFSKKNLIIVFVLIMSATWNFYYLFYFCMFLSLSLVGIYFSKKTKFHIRSILITLVLVILPFSLNMLPYKLEAKENGKNSMVAKRQVFETELYGLKIIQMILPVSNHRDDYLRYKKEKYDMVAPLRTENSTATLGWVATFGFFVLTFMLIIHRKKFDLLKRLSAFNVMGVLFATIGGYSVYFAMLVTPQLRAHNRISVFIAAFSFIAIALVLNYLMKKYNLKPYIYIPLFLVMLAWGVRDQVPRGVSYSNSVSIKNEFNANSSFFAKVENSLKEEESPLVVQLPYMRYPEVPPIHRLGDYTHYLGYVHTQDIRWSYGAIKGREGDKWFSEVSKLPFEKQVEIYKKSGFNGIYIDKRGFVDGGKSIEKYLQSILKLKPLVSDNTKVFYKIEPTGNKIIEMAN